MAISRRTQNRLIIAAAIVILLAGIGLLAYPFVSNALLEQAQGKVLEFQQDAVEKTDDESLEEAKEFALQYNADLLNSRTVVTDPFDEAALKPQDGAYDKALNIAGDGVMGTIYIPKIQVEQPIYHTVDDDVLQKGVGHLQGTSLPIGGDSSHCVLSGHTGLPSGKIFDDLDRLEVGDYFIINVLGEDHAYRIYDIETVLPDETQSLVIQQGRDLCTLVTCTPYGINTHRLLVHAERCEVPQEWLDKDAGDTFPGGYSPVMDRTIIPSVLIGTGLAAAIIAATYGVLRYRARRKAAPVIAAARAAAPAPSRRTSRRGIRVMPSLGREEPSHGAGSPDGADARASAPGHGSRGASGTGSHASGRRSRRSRGGGHFRG